ncbi:hypothetical protein GDO86_011069 [Hymenochirus boettgeri]|uniref:Uncharacterized protein n=1 Tax=Hymenochirus boettgeri TaxID=247094 RepID=A0A8T2JEX1_9PIPI|nr:hypothetical protein GDO86_011067 [Hymenochirus boettgeri]KAG8442129.1 hypothetical protein GDO86_011069 [Hymenochirus boettgeri]
MYCLHLILPVMRTIRRYCTLYNVSRRHCLKAIKGLNVHAAGEHIYYLPVKPLGIFVYFGHLLVRNYLAIGVTKKTRVDWNIYCSVMLLKMYAFVFH